MSGSGRFRRTCSRPAPAVTLRPRYACVALLGCSIGALTFLVSQRTGDSDNAQRRDIGRTIRQRSGSVDGAREPADYSEEMRGVVAEERHAMAAEMDGYQYPSGLYNVTAKSLADLVPELEGLPTRNLVVTTWRSGSTFLGGILNSHPGSVYHYEPLLSYGYVRIREEPLASKAATTLKALFNCNYEGLDHYIEYAKRHVWSFSHNARLWGRCQRHPSLCWLPEFLNALCKLFLFQTVKTVRLSLSLAERLLADSSLNVRVLLLVRDPRATLQSRKHCTWCLASPDCSEARILCRDLHADYVAAKELTEKYPSRFRVVRYEELAVTPHTTAKELFKFFGLDFHPDVEEFLRTHTKVNVGDIYTTFRDSKSAPFHWRQDLSHLEVCSIQLHCKQAMDVWGYLEAFNSTHQREFNPLSDYKLT